MTERPAEMDGERDLNDGEDDARYEEAHLQRREICGCRGSSVFAVRFLGHLMVYSPRWTCPPRQLPSRAQAGAASTGRQRYP